MAKHRIFLIILGALCSVGLVNLYSALHLWDGGTHLRLLWMQMVWMGLGAAIGWLVSRYDYRRLYRHCGTWHIIAIALLAIVIVMGRQISGHRSWFAIGGFGVQPSEFAKLTTVLVLARYFTDTIRPRGFGLRDLWQPALLAGIPAALILLQGDLGTSLFILLLLSSLLLFTKLQWRTLVLLVLVAGIGAGLAYTTVLTPNQKSRITTFLHPESDPRGQGYHLMQSKIAVGSGGWWGRGYLKGQVNKLRYLPEKHTDFVFPVLAEEWGFVGGVVTLGLFGSLLMLALTVAHAARDRFGAYVAVGIAFWLFWQIAINLGGVLGLMPLTGVTLPFLSYGGSSILVAFTAMGVLISVYRKRFLF